MLVKPMKAGVTATVLMDCCHSGTVLDLPYKFGSEDRHVTREHGFPMEVVPEGTRKKQLTDEEWRKKQKDKKKAMKEKDEADKRRAQREEDKHMCGPKLAPNGQPVLPSRPAPQKHIDDNNKQTKEQAPSEESSADPKSSCCVIS